MKRSSLMFLLLVVLCLALVLSACGPKTENPAGETPNGETPSGETPADDTVYELSYAYFGSEAISLATCAVDALAWATEQSNGRLQFETYFGGTILSATDQLGGTSDGVVDISCNNATMMDEMTSLCTVFNLPSTDPLPSREGVATVFEDIVTDIPEFNQEMESYNLRLLALQPTGGYNIHSTKFVKTVDDVTNLKIEAAGYAINYFDALGAAATSLTFADYYTGASTNLIDSQCTHWVILTLSDTVEIYKYHTIFAPEEIETTDMEYCGGGLYLNSMSYVINLDTWNSLPEDLQAIVSEALWTAAFNASAGDKPNIAAAKQTCYDRGDEFVFIDTEEERAPWVAAMGGTIDSWAAEAEAAGFANARDIYADVFARLGQAE